MKAQSQCEFPKVTDYVRLRPVDRVSTQAKRHPAPVAFVGMDTLNLLTDTSRIILVSWTHFPNAVAVEGVVVVRIHWPISMSVHLPLARVLEQSAG